MEGIQETLKRKRAQLSQRRQKDHLALLQVLPEMIRSFFAKGKAPTIEVLVLRRGDLIVETESAAAASELRLRTQKILELIEKKFPEAGINRIVWKF